MTLAPEVQELLAWDQALGTRIDCLDAPSQRRVIRQALGELVDHYRMTAADVARVEEYDVPVDGANLPMRVYTPLGDGPHGAFFHIHGGGFTLGGIDWPVNHIKCAHICANAGCVVTTVDYRLAPESPYPAAIEDCYAALLWLADNATSLGIDPKRTAIGGESAGGNLATVVALIARDRNGPSLTSQVLEVPVADMSDQRTSQPSMTRFGHGYGLDSSVIEAFIDAYLPDQADRQTAYASPLHALDLDEVAPAHVITAEYDPLRDGAEAYASRLREAGVPTTLHRFNGHTHGSSLLWQTWAPAESWMGYVVSAIRAATAPRNGAHSLPDDRRCDQAR